MKVILNEEEIKSIVTVYVEQTVKDCRGVVSVELQIENGKYIAVVKDAEE